MEFGKYTNPNVDGSKPLKHTKYNSFKNRQDSKDAQENKILKNSCKGSQRAIVLKRKKEWKAMFQVNTSKIQSKAKKIHKHPIH
jgi:hypothetical protein